MTNKNTFSKTTHFSKIREALESSEFKGICICIESPLDIIFNPPTNKEEQSFYVAEAVIFDDDNKKPIITFSINNQKIDIEKMEKIIPGIQARIIDNRSESIRNFKSYITKEEQMILEMYFIWWLYILKKTNSQKE